MSLMRTVLLWSSTNPLLSRRLPSYRFVQRAVRRFMPGVDVESAIEEAEKLKHNGITTILTRLGENLTGIEEAEEVCQHYLEVLDKVAERKLDAQVSIKPTQLGMDLDMDRTIELCAKIASKARDMDNFLWIDMESSPYVDPTLDLFRKLREQFDNIGVCVQSYLYRTKQDLTLMQELAPYIRLVKGAYAEPEDLAFPIKADVDREFVELSEKLMIDCKKNKTCVDLATHDGALIGQIKTWAEHNEIPKAVYQFAMLYGINRDLQIQLAREGHRMRVLISYGEHWFPWYMRRLAERPANILFVLKSLFK